MATGRCRASAPNARYRESIELGDVGAHADGARLDAEKLETLRIWGAGLMLDQRDEVRAAGRAIGLLIEEIEHLYVELWHARDGSAYQEEPVDELETTLRRRISQLAAVSRIRRVHPGT